MSKLSREEFKKLADDISECINHHKKYRNCYFWDNTENNSRYRRYKEEQDSWHREFKYGGHIYIFDCNVRMSCKNVYYSGAFYIDNERKDVRCFKKLLKTLQEEMKE